VANADRHQRGFDAPPQQTRTACRVSLDDFVSEGDLPLAERFADDGPNPETALRREPNSAPRMNKKLAEISPLAAHGILAAGN